MGFLRINRFGEVRTSRQSNNQCKDVGHSRYAYHVAIKCCDTNLDSKEFILDHTELHVAVDKVFQRYMSSCEGMILKIQKTLARLCKRHKLQVVDMYIRITPLINEGVQPHNRAFMEYSNSGNFL